MLGKKYNSASNRRFFIYGMALHTATDLFAHSTFENGEHIGHAKKMDSGELDKNGKKIKVAEADCKIKVPNRYACAQEVAIAVIKRCAKNQVGDIDDFICDSYDGTFKIAKFSDYAQETNWSIYWKNRYEFDKMTIRTW